VYPGASFPVSVFGRSIFSGRCLKKTLRKAIASAIANKSKQRLVEYFIDENFPRAAQFACGVSRGTQKNYLAIMEYLRLNPTHIVTLMDVRNAFNEVSLELVMLGIERLGPEGDATRDSLLWFLRAFYANNSELSYFLDSGERTTVTRHTGVSQGCPLGGTMFCLATYPLVKEAIDSPETKDVTYLGYADDNCLAGEMGQAMKAVAAVDDKFRTRAGLEHKCFKVLRGAEAPSPDEIKAQWAKEGLNSDLLEVIPDGFDTGDCLRKPEDPRGGDFGARLVGGPVGSPSYMKKFVEDIAAVDLEILGCIESFGEKHLPEAMKAIKLCMIPRIQFSLSMVPLDIARDFFTRWILQSHLQQTVSTVLRLKNPSRKTRRNNGD
jgi:hypothetical protein